MLAPLSVGFLLTYMSWQSALQISVLPGLIMGLVLLRWWRRVPAAQAEHIGRADLDAMWRVWRRPAGLTVAGLLVAYEAAFVALLAMTPLFLQREHGYSFALTGVVLAVMLTAGAIAGPFIGRAPDVAGRRGVAALTLAGSGAAGLAAALAGGGLLLIGGLVVTGVSWWRCAR